ncbi:hypothetical protein EBX31_01985 [bacterium]|jgi:hypothetical protein|nr:hypothetical protein [bacterium]
MAGSSYRNCSKQLLLVVVCLFANGLIQKVFGQIQGSAGDSGNKPFTASVALREGYDSNPLTQSYQSSQDVSSSTYTSIQPTVGYNYTGLQADLALRYDFTGIYFPSINQSYDIQYTQGFIGRYTYAFDPRFQITISDNFIYSEQPIVTLVTAGLAPLTQTSNNNLGTVQADYRVTDRLSMVTRWNNTILNTDGPSSYNNDGSINSGSSAESNYMNNGAFQQFRLDITPETVGTFTIDYQIYDYQSDQSYRDNQQVSFSIGADHTFLPRLTFSGRAGVQLNDNFGLADSSVVIDSGGLGSGELEIGTFPFASISSTWNYDERSFVSGGFSIAVQQSNLATTSDSEAYTINMNWDHYFTDRISVIQSMFVNFAVFSPQLSQSESVALTGSYQGSGQQTTISYQCKFAYQIFPYLSAETGWSYTSYGSYFDLNNGNGGSYTRNQVYIGLRGTY